MEEQFDTRSDERMAKGPQWRARCNGWCFADGDQPAGECGALEGELHRLGCPEERCTKCSGQFLYCDCPEEYDERQRVPYFELSWLRCERCGEPWPDFFDVPNKVWKHYVLSLGEGDKMLCMECFNVIATLTDQGEFAREHGGAVLLRDIHGQHTREGRARWEEWEKERRHRDRGEMQRELYAQAPRCEPVPVTPVTRQE